MSSALSLLLLSCQADLPRAWQMCIVPLYSATLPLTWALVALDGPGSWCRASKEADKAVEAAAKEERLRVMQARLAAWQAEQSAQ